MVQQMQREILKLRADLHASSLQEEEALSRVETLVQQERINRSDMQRIKNETDTLHSK